MRDELDAVFTSSLIPHLSSSHLTPRPPLRLCWRRTYKGLGSFAKDDARLSLHQPFRPRTFTGEF
jgi:hypothetical protein